MSDKAEHERKREELKKKLRDANFLSTMRFAPDDAVPLSVEERLRFGTLAPNSPSSEQLVSDDRGAF